MQKIATAKEMQAIDCSAIEEYGVPGLVLMENAGRGIVSLLRKKFPDLESKKILIVAGRGNNGGDGFVIARHLLNSSNEVQVLLLGKRSQLKNDARVNAESAYNIGVPIFEVDSENLNSVNHPLRHSHIVIDAIFGTGLTRPAEGIYEKVIKKINNAKKYVVAVDIPSGIDSDSGQLMGPHIRANLTAALALYKRSHVLYPAAEAMGEIAVVDISIPQNVMDKSPIEINMVEEDDVRGYFKKRKKDSHKGDFGHVLVIGGSTGKAGAAALTALAALRMGSGLVTVAIPESCNAAVEFNPLEVMSVPLPETAKGSIALRAKKHLLEQCRGKSAIAVGPGLSTQPETVNLLRELLPEIDCPLVIDADGLNCLAECEGLLDEIKSETVLTPHPKEMSRISGLSTQEIQKDRILASTRFARKMKVSLVLKGARTVIAFPDGSVYINPTGNPGMATAGSGDVLTGIIAGLIAQGFDVSQAVIAGAYIHGLAGDLYAGENSETTLIAGDLLRTLPDSLKLILP